MQEKEELKKEIDERALEVVKRYLNSSGFTSRKLTDTPTDALSMVPRKYVDLNGTTASRPANPSIGQHYFDTTLGIPIWFDGTDFVDATGAPV